MSCFFVWYGFLGDRIAKGLECSAISHGWFGVKGNLMGLSFLLIGKDTYSFSSLVQWTFVNDNIPSSLGKFLIFCLYNYYFWEETVHLGSVWIPLIAENWKYYNKIIFKFVNSTVEPSFKVVFGEKNTYGSPK